MMGDSADQFIAVKARWLLRREPDLKSGGLAVLDYGCGAGDLMRVLAELGARAAFTGCDVSSRHAGRGRASAGRRRLGPAPALAAAGRCAHAVRRPAVRHRHHQRRAAPRAGRRAPGRLSRARPRAEARRPASMSSSTIRAIPLVRYVIARTPIDENAILLDAREVRHGLLDTARYELETDYLMFMPPGIAFLRGIDRTLAWLPLGAQYVVAARKGA